MQSVRTSQTFIRQTAKIKDGIQYVDEGKGIPILFIHGTLSNSDTWRKIIPELSKKYRCIAIDLPIGGHSIPLNDDVDLSPVGISLIIKEFLEYLNIEKIIIVSNDTGGVYSQIFASLYPKNIEKLIFSNCEVLEVFPPSKFKYLITAVKIPGFTSMLGQAFKIKSLLTSNLMMGLLSHKLTNDELSELYLKSFITNKAVRRNFAANIKTWSPKYTIEAAEKLKAFKFPVLVLWGQDDKKLFPIKLGEQLKTVFQNAELITIPNSKTYIQEDQPEIMIKEIIQFIET
jgi:pimeloyl-ACP methyl ester carboxylesterase